MLPQQKTADLTGLFKSSASRLKVESLLRRVSGFRNLGVTKPFDISVAIPPGGFKEWEYL